MVDRSPRARDGKVMIRSLVWSVTAVFMSATILLTPLAGAQEPGVEFAVEPGPRSQTARGGGYFQIRAEPGEAVRQSVSLRNESGRPLTLELTAVDAITGQLGGASYGVPKDAVERTGAWIDLERTEVPLRPGGSASVQFLLTVPENASPGEHLAGIAVSEVGGEAKNGDDEEAVSVVVNTRRIIAVQVDLPGPKVPELVVTGVEAAARPDGLYLEIGIENQGTAMTKGTGEIELPSQDIFEVFDIDTFVPGTQIDYPVRWALSAPEGEYEARVLIEYEGGEATWEGTVIVGEGVRDELADRGVDVPDASIPLLVWLGAVGVVVAVAIALLLLRRRRGVVRSRSARMTPAAKAPVQIKASSTTPAESAPRDTSLPPPPPPPARTSPPSD